MIAKRMSGFTGLARSTRSKQERVCRSSEVCKSDVEIVRLVRGTHRVSMSHKCSEPR